MKARVPINNKTKNKIKQYVLEETEKHMNEVHRAASEVFLLAAACELHPEFGFGKKRLMQFMCGCKIFTNCSEDMMIPQSINAYKS